MDSRGQSPADQRPEEQAQEEEDQEEENFRRRIGDTLSAPRAREWARERPPTATRGPAQARRRRLFPEFWIIFRNNRLRQRVKI
jgi:hypothetical protein